MLLAELKRTAIPQRMERESVPAFESRRMDALDRWIEIAFKANLLDRACKKKASSMTEWRDRDRDSWKTDGTLIVVSLNSGFMATVNPVSAFKDVPLNKDLFADWKLFAVELLQRIESVSPEFIAVRMTAQKERMLGPTSEEGFQERKEAWEETLDDLLEVDRLKGELAKIKALVKSSLAESKSQTAP